MATADPRTGPCPKHPDEPIVIDSVCPKCLADVPPAHANHPYPQRTITHVLPSLWFQSAVVIVVDGCHHRHVRPSSAGYAVGDAFACNLCVEGVK